MLQVAYFQMAGSGKHRNQDALFNGAEVYYALLHKTRRVECAPNAPIRLAISDGVSCSPAPHLASRFWMETFMQHGDAFGRFLCQYHSQFCEARQKRILVARLLLCRQPSPLMANVMFAMSVTAGLTALPLRECGNKSAMTTRCWRS